MQRRKGMDTGANPLPGAPGAVMTASLSLSLSTQYIASCIAILGKNWRAKTSLALSANPRLRAVRAGVNSAPSSMRNLAVVSLPAPLTPSMPIRIGACTSYSSLDGLRVKGDFLPLVFLVDAGFVFAGVFLAGDLRGAGLLALLVGAFFAAGLRAAGFEALLRRVCRR